MSVCCFQGFSTKWAGYGGEQSPLPYCTLFRLCYFCAVGETIDYKKLYQDSQREKALLEKNYALEKSSWEQQRAELMASLDKLRRALFGMSADNRVKLALPGQMELFTLEAQPAVVEQAAEQLGKEIKAQQQESKAPRTAKRMVLPAHLERKEVIIDPQGDLSAYKLIGSEQTEVLVIEPVRMWVKCIVRRKWALQDSRDITRPGILEAPAPSRTVKRGLFDESVLAFLLISKYVYHLPLYRIRQMFAREDIPISASTLSDNVAAVCKALGPIYNALKREVLGSLYLQSDETTYKVLQGGKKGSCHNGYMWAFHSPPSGLLFFQYCDSREHVHPKKMLQDFHGVLQTDGYQAYGTALAGNERVKQLFCMSHIRRKFDESADNDLPRAKHAVEEIAAMYAIEKQIREASPTMAEDEIVQLRLKEVKPILERMKLWMIAEYPKVLPKSPIGKAMGYALKLWDNMHYYTLHGHLQLDNNSIENTMRPIALGRKNHLFSGTHDTAQNAAMVYSLFATCKKHGVDPQNWITDVLYKINDPEYEGKYSDLMPHRWKNTQI
ncbi:IS66 family transposase [Arcticibacter eurypsychrophilus]|uniref:IS66 family transposase n=1 Tax=Arcticibacter eurypsychrophilus TaxID=1434752 RepID=UPI000B2474EA|nr:IS66 family transposase [Arcticibacter eurypsychrophilus]